MKLVFSKAVLTAFSLSAFARAQIAKEDAKFWDRFLQNEDSLSMTPPPTPGPTPPPTGVECDVDVTLECKLPDGRPCTALVPPDNTQCAAGTDIDTVTFSFQFCVCDPNANRQGDEASCEDNAALDFTQPVDMVCVAAANGAPMNVEPSTVVPEGTVTITTPGGGSLPDKIRCELSQGGQVVQTNVIDTSGEVSLNLRDKFGHLQLESCDDELTCIETVCYDVTLENVGTNDMDITVVDFDFNGDVESLLDELDTTTLAPGESTSVEVKKEVDICVEVDYCANVEVEADPPSNMMCQDEDEDKFFIRPPGPTPEPTPPPTPAPTPPPTPGPTPPPTPGPTPPPTPAPTPPPTPGPTPPPTPGPTPPPTPGPTPPPTPGPTPPPTGVECLVDVTIDCVTPEGLPCNEIEGPGGQMCADGTDIDTVSFTYQFCLCDESDNNQGEGETLCTDIGEMINPNDPVIIGCNAVGGGPLSVSPMMMTPGDVFSVTSPGGGSLPDQIECTISSVDGRPLQFNVINTSGDVELNVGDKFGGMRLEGCDAVGDCIQEVCYGITLENVGTNDMDITLVMFDLNGMTEDLLDQLPTQQLAPGESTGLEVKRDIDICQEIEYCAEVDVEANPPSDLMCEDTDKYPFTPFRMPTPPPTPAPTPMPTEECVLNLDLNCTIGSGEFAGEACETPGIGVEPCRDRPTGATMLFNGGDCSQSDNRQFLKFTCVDLGEVPTEDGEMAYIIVTDAKGKGIVYHRGFVEVGTPYYLRTPEGEDRFEADQRIMIYRDENTGDAGSLLQEVQYHSSCSSNLELKNRFGASQLIEFINEEQGNVTCFAAVDFDLDIVIPLEIDGTSATLQRLTALTNFAGFLDFTDQVAGMEIPPGGSITVSIPAELDLTERRRYTILTQVTAIANPSGQVCTGTDFNSFLAGNPASPSLPTRAPTVAPTISPAPTPNIMEASCEVDAMIFCETLDEAGRAIQDCTAVRDPRTVSCENNLPATGVTFRYLGGGGLPNEVFISLSGGRSGVVFSEVVAVDEVFRADGDFRGEVQVEISTVDNGAAGNGIEDYTIDVACEDTPLTLTTTYGPLELVGFVNALGFFSSITPVRVQYIVSNPAAVNMIAESAFVNSQFANPFNAVTSDTPVDKNSQVRVEDENLVIDWGDKFSSNVAYAFAMNATGRASQSGLSCFDQEVYSF